MSKIFKSATELIGNTPLVELTNFEKELGCLLYTSDAADE